MTQWGFYFDQTRCFGCKACMMACKNWNDDKRGDYDINTDSMNPETDWYTSGTYCVAVDEMEDGTVYRTSEGQTNYELQRKYYMKEDWRRVNSNISATKINYTSVSCNHCENPACIEACPMGIIYKEETYGIVMVNNETCISCGRCKAACPWGAPQYYDKNFASYAQSDAARPKMNKCTLCLDRIKEGLKPACVAACLNRALDAGPLDEIKEKWTSFGKTVVEASSMDSADFASSTGVNPNIIFCKKTT